MLEKYHHICTPEHSEAFFANKIVLVEGATEQYAYSIYAQALGYNFDTNSISIVGASKGELDIFYLLYSTFSIPVYLIFDNDKSKPSEYNNNRKLLKMLGEIEQDAPSGGVRDKFAIHEDDFETQMQNSLGVKYAELEKGAKLVFGSKVGKPIVARYMAKKLVEAGIIPLFIEKTIEAIKSLGA